MLLTEITAPTAEPVDAADVKAHTRIDGADDDALLGVYITAARALAEAETGRQFMTATYDLLLDAFPSGDEIVLPLPPLQSVTHVKYLDAAGVEQTWSSSEYVVRAPAGPHCRAGRIRLAYGYSWPTTQLVRQAVRIRFVCGYSTDSDPTDVPSGIRQAIMVGVAESFKIREESIQGTISTNAAMTMARLLGPFRALETAWQ